MNEDIFNSLLDVEQDASNMVFEAQVEADSKVESVKSEIDEKYRLAHEKIVGTLEGEFVQQKKLVDDSINEELVTYQNSLLSIKPDFIAFNKILNSYFCLEVDSKNARSNN
ncbi:MAG: hypothetical protein ACTTJ6_08190 [Treponema sp.]